MSPHVKPPFALPAAATRRMHYYYYALPVADGRWQLLNSRQPSPEYHANKEAAMQAARGHCRRQWEEDGTPFGIRVRDVDGNWLDALIPGVGGPAVSTDGATIG